VDQHPQLLPRPDVDHVDLAAVVLDGIEASAHLVAAMFRKDVPVPDDLRLHDVTGRADAAAPP
jgi:hypothetical protein